MKKCNLCDNKGIYSAAMGPDDSEKVYCSCPAGRSAELFDTDFFKWLKEQKKAVLNSMKV